MFKGLLLGKREITLLNVLSKGLQCFSWVILLIDFKISIIMVIFIYFYYLTGRAESILSCTDAANLLKRSVSKTSSATCCSNGESLQSHSSLNPTIRAPISVLSFHKVGAILPYQNEQNYRSASSYFFSNSFFLFSNLGGPPPEALHTTLL